MINHELITWFDEIGRRYWPILLPAACLLVWWFHYALFKRQLRSALMRFRHRQIAGIARRRELQESEERLRVILSSILTGVTVVNPHNRKIEFVNPAACQLLGGKKKEILGRQIEDFELAVEELDEGDSGFSLLTDTPKQRQLITLQGERLPVLENTSSITIHGAPFLLRSYLDLSELTQARHQVEQLHSNLTKRVQELHCLFGVTGLLAQDHLSGQELLQRVVNLVPLAMRRPHFAVARIELAGTVVSSETFVQTSWHLQRPVFVSGEEQGRVEVCYIQHPAENEEVFEREEISLVETLAQRLGRHFESLQAATDHELTEQLVEQCPCPLMVVEASGQVRLVNERGCELIGMRHDDLVGHELAACFQYDGDLQQLPAGAQLELQPSHSEHSPPSLLAQLARLRCTDQEFIVLYLQGGS